MANAHVRFGRRAGETDRQQCRHRAPVRPHHLHALAALAAPTLGGDHPGWLAERLAELDAGDVPAMLVAARALALPDTQARDLDKALGYFETNQARMRYANFRQSGL